MRIILVIAILTLTFFNSSYGQSKKEYKKLLNTEITVKDLQENLDEFIKNLQTIVYREFDTIDFQILMGPMGNNATIPATFLASKYQENKNNIPTYNDLKDMIKDFKSQQEYSQVRKIVESRNKLIVKKASLLEWDNDKKLLEDMGLTKPMIEETYQIIKEHNDDKFTYTDVFVILSNKLEAKQPKPNTKKEFSYLHKPSKEYLIKGLSAYNDYNLGIKMSKELNKPSLIYFNGHACVNARDIEFNILLKPEIQEIINNNFNIINLYLDDKRKIEGHKPYYSNIIKKEVKYIGDIHQEIEIELYKSNIQPLFIILNKDGKEIARQGYTKDIEEFKKFLQSVK